jgi:NADPH:quinone reductase-like Zn-dependent oxidoreductase
MAARQRRVVGRRRRVAPARQGLGARVIGTSGTPRSCARCARSALDVALHTRQPISQAPCSRRPAARRGPDREHGRRVGVRRELRALAFEGRLATVGYVDGVVHADIDLETVHARRLTIFGVSNKLRSKAQRASAVPRFVAEIVPHVAGGTLRPVIDRVVDFGELATAKTLMESGAHVGKIVLRMPSAH